MDDQNFVNDLRNVIEHHKQEAVEILRHRFTDDEIKELCDRIENAAKNTELQKQFETEGYPQETYFAVTSLCYLMYLERNVPPDNSCLVPGSFVANLVLVGFGAGMFLVEAGWKPSEPFALTRLAQVRNQPKTRKRETPENDNIFEMLEHYVKQKKHHPEYLYLFIDYLEANDYEIDHETRTVDEPKGSKLNWKKPIAFGTIDNWRREYKKFIDS